MAVIKSSGYPVLINKKIGKEINEFFKDKKNSYSKIFILVDENTIRYCYPPLAAKVGSFKDAEIIEIESGEDSKNIDVCSQIWSTLSEYGADRKSLIVNLGGGVITDMGGFIASTFKRGIDFINIPTTLLSQVDASLGGKTGINHNNLKNEVGTFHFPRAVFINSSFLESLEQRQFLSGFAEIIKHALIADPAYWKKVKLYKTDNRPDPETLIEISVKIKNKIVLQDPQEQNIRKALNFGHTVGHAIETLFLEHYPEKQLLHGEAVAIGMICETHLSSKICKLPKEQLSEITKFILGIYAHVNITGIDEERIIQLMTHDKKNSKGIINFSLLESIGKCVINKTAKTEQIIDALRYYQNEAKTL
jgi:3-dehydroquinate synthase